MSVSQIAPEDLVVEDFEWPEPDAPRSPYMTAAQGKEQARNLYLTELTEVTQAINGLKDRRPEIVRLAKANGATWEEIGDALGTSRQAACRTYND
jgi:DNA-directed RNA polymerase specialized sigma24 family protein